MTKRVDAILLVVVFAVIVVALYIIPRLVPTSEADVISVGAAVGYNTSAAFLTVLVWFALAIILFALPTLKQAMENRGIHLQENESLPESRTCSRFGRLDWVEIVGVFLVFAIAYMPFFLARHGPYMEDIYFLAALQRMECGQLPYSDFAFLYGPLMIYPVWGWCQVFGTSMVSYFGFLSIIEGLQFAILIGVLQYFIPERKKRYWVFILLLPFLFNTLLGLNYNGLRRMVPLLALVLVAYRPFDRKSNLVSALLLGFQLAYSHEYGIAALFGVTGIYAVSFLRGDRAASVRAAALIISLSLTVWAAIMFLVLGNTFADYARSVAEVVGMMSEGHADFRFYWTANSLALFGLLTIAIGAVGKGLLPRQAGDFQAGDRLLLGAVLCAIVMLKSGLTRSDLWHLDAGFLTLLIAFLLPLPSKAMTVAGAYRRVANGLVIVASATYLIGIAPTGSLYATSYIRGFMDTISERSAVAKLETRGPSIEFERTEPRAQFVELGQYLAAPERANRPVLFYGQAWAIQSRVGVCAEDYKLDDLMYSEFRRPEAVYLKEHPRALVVIRNEDYEYLFGPANENTPVSDRKLSITKRLGRWLSTVHYDASAIQDRLHREARARLTGQSLTTTHKRAARFGDYFVLAPN